MKLLLGTLPLLLVVMSTSIVEYCDLKDRFAETSAISGSFYGSAVETTTSFAFVGSIGDGISPLRRSGSVFVYSKPDWTLSQKLLPAVRGSNFQFGTAISASEMYCAVGAPNAKFAILGESINSGLAYVFEVQTKSRLWSEVATLSAPDGQQYDEFGRSIAVSNTTIAVGAAYHDSEDYSDSGAVYIFRRIAQHWSFHSALVASDQRASLNFGHSVAMSSEKFIAVSSLKGNDFRETGAVYFFSRDPSFDSYIQNQRISPSNSLGGDEFGVSISVSDNELLIGARYALNGNQKSGAVYVFSRGVSAWSQAYMLRASDSQEGALFGDSISRDGNRMIVGSSGWSDGPTASVGSAYVFFKDHTGKWSEMLAIRERKGVSNDNFGKSVSINGAVALIGVSGEDVEELNTGSAYRVNIVQQSSSQPSGRISETKTVALVVLAVVGLGFIVYVINSTSVVDERWDRWFRKIFGLSLRARKKRSRRGIDAVEPSALRMDESVRDGGARSTSSGGDDTVYDDEVNNIVLSLSDIHDRTVLPHGSDENDFSSPIDKNYTDDDMITDIGGDDEVYDSEIVESTAF
jgi:hypothetical protein